MGTSETSGAASAPTLACTTVAPASLWVATENLWNCTARARALPLPVMARPLGWGPSPSWSTSWTPAGRRQRRWGPAESHCHFSSGAASDPVLAGLWAAGAWVATGWRGRQRADPGATSFVCPPQKCEFLLSLDSSQGLAGLLRRDLRPASPQPSEGWLLSVSGTQRHGNTGRQTDAVGSQLDHHGT